MDEQKSPSPPLALPVDSVTDQDVLDLAREDKAVMVQMGKRQQLVRRFNFFSIFGLSLTLLSSWEAIGGSMGVGMTAGGPVSLVYGLIFTFTGTLACAASIAEMASICPISGAQYHWTYMFAPRKSKVFASFIQGWVTVFGWQATISSLTLLLAGQIQGVAILNNPAYVPERWHTTLLMWAVVLVSYAQNIWGVGLLPAFELFAGAMHVLLFIVLFITMLVLGRNASAEFVFTGFVNQTGWENRGVVWFVGLLPCIWCIIGFDGAIHLSEETEKSALVIPKVIVNTVLINGSMAWIFVLLCLFSISDISAVLDTPTGYPLIEIIQQATSSRVGATAIYSFILAITFAAMFGTLASVSRLTWAFARDDGLPFSNYFKYVDPKHKVPSRAVGLVSVVIILLSLINIGSSVALNAILSLSTIALYTSYIIPITCLIFMRIRVKDKVYDSPAGFAEISEDCLVFGPWNLGRWGMLINIYGACYATLLLPFMALPTSLPLTKETMNYAGPIFLFVLCFASLDYLIRGRSIFTGPTRER
ncbi:amino acid/polyamine transporter I [Paraphoma chrysanthemicola]|nr:amino acid/polyamine transporter I [Paraphoma chrysanthemicola]